MVLDASFPFDVQQSMLCKPEVFVKRGYRSDMLRISKKYREIPLISKSYFKAFIPISQHFICWILPLLLILNSYLNDSNLKERWLDRGSPASLRQPRGRCARSGGFQHPPKYVYSTSGLSLSITNASISIVAFQGPCCRVALPIKSRLTPANPSGNSVSTGIKA